MQTLVHHLFRITCCLLIAATLCAAQEIKTVIAEGIGSDPQGAAQDAAQNALTNVVGSFIDANKQLEKRTEIRDGIRSQTTQIRTDIKEYSQGSIQSFEIAETKKDGSFYRVTAKVRVRVAEFRAYVKKLAEGETAVSGGLFAEMSTNQRQTESLAKILSERIMAVVKGEAVRFSVSKPMPFSRSRFVGQRFVGGGVAIPSLAQRFGPDRLVVLDVTASLDEAFLSNLIQTLDSVASSKQRMSTNEETSTQWMMYQKNGNCGGGGSTQREVPGQRLAGSRFADSRRSDPSGGQSESSFCLPLLDANPGTATVYRFSSAGSELTQNLPWVSGRWGSYDVAGQFAKANLLPTLEIAFLDNNGSELQVELVSASRMGNDKTALDAPSPWLLYYQETPTSGPLMARKRSFSVVTNVEEDALKRATSVRIKLVK